MTTSAPVPAPKPLAFSYRRFSHVKQDEKSSLKRQRDIAVAYCEKHGLQLVDDEQYTFLDKAKSAYHGKNLSDTGELRRFYDLVEAKAIPVGSYLIVESLDRLSRQHPREALPRFFDLLNAGINIVSVNDDRLYTGKVSELDLIVSIMEMSRSHSESAHKSKRVAKAWKDKQEDARTGKPMGATKPAWLDAVYREEDKKNPKKKPTHYVINEAKAEIVRRIFRWTTEGYGREVIARMLNEADVPSFRGKTWGGSSVAQIIKSPTVLGIYQPMTGKGKDRKPVGDPIKGLYEPIISEHDFYAANGAMTDRFKGVVKKQSARFNLWQKIAKCTVCGSALHTVTKGNKDPVKQRTYMQCGEARKGKCTAKAVRLDRSEIVFKQLLAKVNSLSLIQDNKHTIQAELHEVEGRLSEQQAMLASHADHLRKQAKPSPLIYQLVTECEAEIAKLEQRRNELEQALAVDTIEDKEAFFAKLDLTSREGRARANGLLMRLKILVFLDPARHHYAVEQDGKTIFDILHLPEQEPSFYPAGSVTHRGLIQRQEGTFTPLLRGNDDDDYDSDFESEGHDARDGY